MIKKIVFAAIAIAVLVAGYTGFKKLNYWQRSARIFSYDPNQVNSRFGRGDGRDFERGPGQFESRERGSRNFSGNGEIPDSLRRNESYQRPPRGEFNRGEALPPNFERREPGRGEAERGEFGRGAPPKKVNLRNVWWFLAVFSGFTVTAIYGDKLIRVAVKRSER